MGQWSKYRTSSEEIQQHRKIRPQNQGKKLRWVFDTFCTTYKKMKHQSRTNITITTISNPLPRTKRKTSTFDLYANQSWRFFGSNIKPYQLLRVSLIIEGLTLGQKWQRFNKFLANSTYIIQTDYIQIQRKINPNHKMLTRNITRICYRMCQITPQIYETLFNEFNKKPQLATLGKYLKPTNLLQVYNIVKYARINVGNKIELLGDVEKQLCTENTDLEFNILANIHREKSMLYLQQGAIGEAIIEIERAVKAIQAMEQPFNLEVATLLQTAANLHIKAKSYPKAQKFLKDAQHVLNLTQEEILQSPDIEPNIKQQQIIQINSLMAKIMSQFCLVHMQQLHPFESRKYLAKALQRWKTVQNKNNLAYLLTIKFKCILHGWVKEEALAIQSAKEYLEKFQPTQETVGHRMWFMKFLIDKGINTYADELKSNIQELSKTLGEKELTDFLIKIGVIKKPANEKPPAPKQQ